MNTRKSIAAAMLVFCAPLFAACQSAETERDNYVEVELTTEYFTTQETAGIDTAEYEPETERASEYVTVAPPTPRMTVPDFTVFTIQTEMQGQGNISYVVPRYKARNSEYLEDFADWGEALYMGLAQLIEVEDLPLELHLSRNRGDIGIFQAGQI